MQNISYQDFKLSCSKLSSELKKEGIEIPHTRLLEIMSKTFGYKNYNTFRGINHHPNIDCLKIYLDKKLQKDFFQKFCDYAMLIMSVNVNKNIIMLQKNCDYIKVDFSILNKQESIHVKEHLFYFMKSNKIFNANITKIEQIVNKDLISEIVVSDNIITISKEMYDCFYKNKEQ